MTGQRSVVAVLTTGTATAVFGVLGKVAPGWWLAAVVAGWLTVRAWRGRSVPDGVTPFCPLPGLTVAVEVLADEHTRLSLWHALHLGDDVHGYPVLLDGPYPTNTGVETVLMIATGTWLDDWRSKVDELAAALAVPEVRCTDAGPGLVRVDVRVVDPLVVPVPCPVPSEIVDLQAVPVGVLETGEFWRVGVLYRHLLVVGVTGSGKGSVLWSVLAGLGPAIRDGLVSVRVVDPKGGMEFGCGAALFERFAPDAGERALSLLRDAVEVMQERAARLAGVVRKHVPSSVEPLILVIVDEAASLAAYCPDRKQRGEFEGLLALLLSQGRAVGVSVILACQDPSKETLGRWRPLVPVRVALRLRESHEIPMVLGPGARDRGAKCDRIPDSLPGVGYVDVDGQAEPVRVRAFEVTDSDIDALAQLYTPVQPALSRDPSTTGRRDEHLVVELDEVA